MTEVLKGKKLADDITNLAKELNIDLSKADYKKTKRYLRNGDTKITKLLKLFDQAQKQLKGSAAPYLHISLNKESIDTVIQALKEYKK